MIVDLLKEGPRLHVVANLRQLDAHGVRTVPRLLQEAARVRQDADERVAVFATGGTVRDGDDEERLLELVRARRVEQERLKDLLVEGLQRGSVTGLARASGEEQGWGTDRSEGREAAEADLADERDGLLLRLDAVALHICS